MSVIIPSVLSCLSETARRQGRLPPAHGDGLVIRVDCALRWLRKLLAPARCHVPGVARSQHISTKCTLRNFLAIPPKLDQDSLHCVLPLPRGQAGQLGRLDSTVVRADTGQIDHADKLDRRGLVRVLGSAVHLDRIDAVLVYALGSYPVSSYNVTL